MFDNFYGTGRAQVEALRNAGHDVILEIDWQGARQVRAAQPDCKSVFILPPSRRELEARLRNRKTDSDAGHRTATARLHRRHVAFRGVRLRDRQRRLRSRRPAAARYPARRAPVSPPDAPDLKPLLAELLA